MRNVQIFLFCCLSVARADALAVVEASGRVGEDVSVLCSGNWTAEDSPELPSLHFCRGICSRETTVVQTPAKAAAARSGRFGLSRRAGGGGRRRAFQVNIEKLEAADAGRYYCGVGETVIVLYQEVNLKVRNDALFPMTPQPEDAAAAATGPSLATSAPSPAPRPTAGSKTNPRAAPRLTETMVVIITSVSLGLLVCAVIPVIFYLYWRSSSEDQSKRKRHRPEVSCCDEDVCVELRAVKVPGPGGRGANHRPDDA